ncbi:MAG: hypothetical protein IPJ20_19080 [Flammeovirgaceae bacterium]|jgi:hypothetical protein|nr:hypothetical protein [Flammeovirgaceae bacterium]
MNTSRRSKRQEREKKGKSEQPIPFHRRGLNEDDQRKVTNNNTNEDEETENSFYYVSTARQDKKIYKPRR